LEEQKSWKDRDRWSALIVETLGDHWAAAAAVVVVG
jgi:hypothetical protein